MKRRAASDAEQQRTGGGRAVRSTTVQKGDGHQTERDSRGGREAKADDFIHWLRDERAGDSGEDARPRAQTQPACEPRQEGEQCGVTAYRYERAHIPGGRGYSEGMVDKCKKSRPKRGRVCGRPGWNHVRVGELPGTEQ